MNRQWITPTSEEITSIKTGDMPGDKIQIEDSHIDKAIEIMNILQLHYPHILDSDSEEKYVLSVHGGSGVGKSEIGSLLGYFLNQVGINCYIMSGDNYPHRIPLLNDAERRRVFEEYGFKGLVQSGEYSKEIFEKVFELQEVDQDANFELQKEYPWLEQYQNSGKNALKQYLGTPSEIDFEEVSAILKQFKSGESSIALKRMGRTKDVLYYDKIDFSNIKVMIVEWTHGNNKNLHGVDIPILLNSTPEETLAHRRKRNRDGGLDSPFTTMVLGIEQELLVEQSIQARVIVAKDGHIMTHQEFNELMK